MTIKVLAFGIAKEMVGGNITEIELEAPVTATQLRASLALKYPRLQQLKTFMIAVNNEYATGTEQISEGDELAIIPPVSGG